MSDYDLDDEEVEQILFGLYENLRVRREAFQNSMKLGLALNPEDFGINRVEAMIKRFEQHKVTAQSPTKWPTRVSAYVKRLPDGTYEYGDAIEAHGQKERLEPKGTALDYDSVPNRYRGGYPTKDIYYMGQAPKEPS